LPERVEEVLEIEPDEVLAKEWQEIYLVSGLQGIGDIAYRIGWKIGNEYLLHWIYS
jgi:hypothetical protein